MEEETTEYFPQISKKGVAASFRVHINQKKYKNVDNYQKVRKAMGV